MIAFNNRLAELQKRSCVTLMGWLALAPAHHSSTAIFLYFCHRSETPLQVSEGKEVTFGNSVNSSCQWTMVRS